MSARERAAEFPGDKNGVARSRAAAQDLFSTFHQAEQRNGDQNAFGICRGLAAGDGHAVFFRELIQAVVNFGHELRVESFGQRDRHERGSWRAGHRGDVAQAAGQGLAPDFPGASRE